MTTTPKYQALLVEDEQPLCQLFQLATEKRPDFSFDFANTVSGAKNKLCERDYDLGVVDLGLPDSPGGLATLDMIVPAAKETPIVVMTGTYYPESEVIARGARFMLRKPDDFDFASLFRFLALVIELERVQIAPMRKELGALKVTATNSGSRAMGAALDDLRAVAKKLQVR